MRVAHSRSDPLGLHLALCCGCGAVQVVDLTDAGAATVPRQRAVVRLACDVCGTSTRHAYVRNVPPPSSVAASKEDADTAARAVVRRLVGRLAAMGVVVGYLSADAAPPDGSRAVVVELADGWRGIGLRAGLAPTEVLAALQAAGAALFSEAGWVSSDGGRAASVR